MLCRRGISSEPVSTYITLPICVRRLVSEQTIQASLVGYNNLWKNFFARNPNASAARILAFRNSNSSMFARS